MKGFKETIWKKRGAKHHICKADVAFFLHVHFGVIQCRLVEIMMGLHFAPRHLLVPPVEWLTPSFTVISRISYFPFLLQRKNIKLKDTCIKMFTVAFLKMENLIIKYPRKE